MPRYIDQDKLVSKRDEYYATLGNEYGFGSEYVRGYGDAINDIEDEPAVDVQEVRYGKMNIRKSRSTNRNATYKCSVCWKLCSSYYNDIGEWKFCPHCGARMDGGESK